MSNPKPDIEGPHGKAWRFDLDAAAKKSGLTNHATLVGWKIYAPWANIAWHSYLLVLIHLRKAKGLKSPIIHVPGATHEIMLWALDPSAYVPLDDVPHKALLYPINFAAQWQATDADAIAKIESCVREIVAGELSPDTDFRQAWIKRFNAGMIKGDPSRAGETKIIIQQGNKTTEILHDPQPADKKPI